MWETLLVGAVCGAFALVFFYKTASLLEFVVTTSEPPVVAEARVREFMHPRRLFSPYPVIHVQVVESVGGANVRVRQRPRLFWWQAMAATFVLFTVAEAWSYALHKPLSDRLFTFPARWLYAWNDLFPGLFAAILAIEATFVIGGLFYARRQIFHRGENA